MTAQAAQRNTEVVLEAIAALKAGDAETFFAAMHPGVEIDEPRYLPYGGVYHGLAGFHELAAKAASIIDGSTVEILTTTVDEHKAVLLMTVQRVSDRSPVLLTEHWTLEDGKVTHIKVFWFELP